MPRQYRKRHEGYNIKDAAAACGISYWMLRYHIAMGDCPAPELGCKRKYYTQAEVVKLIEYWRQIRA